MSEENFDKFVKKLQQEIINKEINEYNEYIVTLFQKPKNWGKPSQNEITVSQSYKGPCGDTMEFFLKINNDIIEEIHFITDGCGASVATGSQTTLLLESKNLQYAEDLKAEEIDKALGGLPDDHKHCAELAVKTLKKAIEKYKNKSV
jgi:nitrogen fixation NifU-like protein